MKHRLLPILFLFLPLLSFSQFSPKFLQAWDGDKFSFLDTLGNEIVPWSEDFTYVITNRDMICIMVKSTRKRLYTAKGKFVGEFDRVDFTDPKVVQAHVKFPPEKGFGFDGYVLSFEGDTIAELPSGRVEDFHREYDIAPATVGMEWVDRGKHGFGSNGGKQGFLRKNGEWLVEPEAEYCSEFEFPGWGIMKTTEGWFAVNLNGEKNRLNFSLLSNLKLLSSGIRVYGDGQYRLYNHKGKPKSKAGVSNIQFLDGEYYVAKYGVGLLNIFSPKGKPVMEEEYDQIYPMPDGRARLLKGNRWGIYDYLEEEWVYPMEAVGLNYQLTGQEDPRHVIILIADEGQFGLMKENGDMILEPQFDQIAEFRQGYAKVIKNFKVGLIDYKGNIIVPAENDFGESTGGYITGNLMTFPGKKKMGVIDLNTGEWVTKPKYDNLTVHPSGYYPFFEKEGFGICTSKGKELLAPKYKRLFYSLEDSSGVFWLKFEDKWGLWKDKEFVRWMDDKIMNVSVNRWGQSELQVDIASGDSGDVTIRREYWLLDGEGNNIKPEDYYIVSRVSDSLYLSQTLAGYGYLDANFKEILPPVFGPPEFRTPGGYYLLKYLNGKPAGYINERGKVFFEVVEQ